MALNIFSKAAEFIKRANPLENPAISLSSPAIWQWMSNGEPTVSGEQVNESNAMKLITVYGCVKTIAEQMGSLPIKVTELTAKGHQEAFDNNLYSLLSMEPNPMMDVSTFIETLAGSMALTGNGYAQIERHGKSGQIVALWPLHPFKTEPVIERNILFYETSDGMPLGQKRKVAAKDILHVKRFSLDGLRGISPIEACRQGIGLAMAQEKAGARHFGNGLNPGGILINKNPNIPDPKRKKEFQDSFVSQHGGNNQGKTAFLWGADWSYQQIEISNQNSQWLESRAMSRADIAAGIFGVPPHMLGDMSRMSGTNAEQQQQLFLDLCLRPYIVKMEGEFRRKLLNRVGSKANKLFISFDENVLVRADFKTQQDSYTAGIVGGWYTPNDVLRKLGENTGGPELDVYRVPVNYQNAARLLDTESLQDQPINADPDANTDTAPTQDERNMLKTYSNGYLPLYKDAFSRLSKRNKRDSDTIAALFRPVISSIADRAIGHCGGDDAIDGQIVDGVVSDALKVMAKRAAKWPEALTDDIMATEFSKTVRAIHIEAARSIAGAKAIEEITEVTEYEKAA